MIESAARVRLEPMSGEAFLRFRENSIRNYAAEQMRAGDWTLAEAPALALKAFENLLPLGLATVGHELFEVMDADADGAVGILWYAQRERAGEPIAYVYEVEILPDYRRRGFAQAAFLALEARVRAQGMRGISLLVFGHIRGARALTRDLTLAVTR